MITFQIDQEIDPIDPKRSIEDLSTLLGFLCGQKISSQELSEEAKYAIELFLDQLRKKGESNVNVSCEEFNELLLLFNQHRIEHPFFDFFFLGVDPCSEKIEKASFAPFSQIKSGVKRFRGYAMLCFGNYRFAFRKLSEEKDLNEFMMYVDPCNRDSQRQRKEIEERQEPLTPLIGSVDEIELDKTWLTGYLSSDLLETDARTLDEVLREARAKVPVDPKIVEDLKKAQTNLIRFEKDAKETLSKGRRNTVRYLTWDYLDVYVATSMRASWEFEETYTFIKKLFLEELKDLPKIRWFDPTQSYCNNVIDKGLLEGLMLKRAKCTIYMAQQGETLGKDSELAATLAQGKPVIAFVPEIKDKDLSFYADEIKQKPIRYFRQRLLTLLADGFFEKPDNRRRIMELMEMLKSPLAEDQIEKEVARLLKVFSDFEANRRFQIITDEEKDFRSENTPHFEFAAKFFTAIESRAADIRAGTIKSKHPLGIQVHLDTGVANGVLVARSLRECANLLRGVLTWDLTFDIEVISKPNTTEKLATVLVEKETRSRYRVVTKDECLTNSFWNFYLEGHRDAWYNFMKGKRDEESCGI